MPDTHRTRSYPVPEYFESSGPQTDSSGAFIRGWIEADLDFCENIPFCGIGGLDQRHDPLVPSYIPKEQEKEWMDGYFSHVFYRIGPDWKTIEFNWQVAITLAT